jgi:hypothetical protein
MGGLLESISRHPVKPCQSSPNMMINTLIFLSALLLALKTVSAVVGKLFYPMNSVEI